MGNEPDSSGRVPCEAGVVGRRVPDAVRGGASSDEGSATKINRQVFDRRDLLDDKEDLREVEADLPYLPENSPGPAAPDEDCYTASRRDPTRCVFS